MERKRIERTGSGTGPARGSGARGRTRAALALLVHIALPLTAFGAVGAAGSDTCGLLTDADIRAVQGRDVVERIASAQLSETLHVAQCVYRSDDFSSSVSLAVTGPRAGVDGGPRRYWNARFHPEGGHRGKEEPPRPVEGLGEEAYWVGDAAVGALYVLRGEQFLRISVGGVRDAEARQQRAMMLAARALTRAAAAGLPAPR